MSTVLTQEEILEESRKKSITKESKEACKNFFIQSEKNSLFAAIHSKHFVLASVSCE